MCAFLGITTDRMKIVGVYSGSTVVDFTITPPLTNTSNSQNANPNSDAIVNDLKALAKKVSSATPADIGNLLGTVVTTNIMQTSG